MIVSAPQKAATKVPLMNVSVSLSHSSLKHAYHEDGAPAGGEVGVGLRREDAEHVVVLQPVSIATHQIVYSSSSHLVHRLAVVPPLLRVPPLSMRISELPLEGQG